MLGIGTAWVVVDAKEPAQHTVQVPIECDGILPKGNAGHSGRGIASHPRQQHESLRTCRQVTAHLLYDLPRGLMKVPGAGIVAKSFPCFEHIIQWRCRQGFHSGEVSQEPHIVVDDRFDPCLLEHDLCYPDGIGVFCATPGKVAVMAFVPVQESLADDGCVLDSVDAMERCHNGCTIPWIVLGVKNPSYPGEQRYSKWHRPSVASDNPTGPVYSASHPSVQLVQGLP